MPHCVLIVERIFFFLFFPSSSSTSFPYVHSRRRKIFFCRRNSRASLTLLSGRFHRCSRPARRATTRTCLLGGTRLSQRHISMVSQIYNLYMCALTLYQTFFFSSIFITPNPDNCFRTCGWLSIGRSTVCQHYTAVFCLVEIFSATSLMNWNLLVN